MTKAELEAENIKLASRIRALQEDVKMLEAALKGEMAGRKAVEERFDLHDQLAASFAMCAVLTFTTQKTHRKALWSAYQTLVQRTMNDGKHGGEKASVERARHSDATSEGES
jgi:hypothetical protein